MDRLLKQSPAALLMQIQASVCPVETVDEQRRISGFQPELLGIKAPTRRREAAVLMPIIQRGEAFSMLFTLRSDELKSHPGQVSFPGGSIEKADADAVAAALRETEEEVGISRSSVRTLGILDPFDTSTGFRIRPVVGLINNPPPYVLEEAEVAEAFEVPLTRLLDRQCYRPKIIRYQNREFSHFAFDHKRYTIWGATAGILMQFIERLEAG